MTMRRLGQHFLRNDGVVQKIISTLEISKGDTLVEIGPGHGELTVPLTEACEKKDCRIIAIERDERLAQGLKEKMRAKNAEGAADSTHGSPDVEIITGDALRWLRSDSAPHGPYKLVGNIPYYLTGNILRAVGEREVKPERVVFMVQSEVAERICAAPPAMNRLAASIQYWAEPKTIISVPRGDFSPPPEVDSALILLKTKRVRADLDLARYYCAVRTLFSQPRKTVLNNLALKLGGEEGGKEGLSHALREMQIDPFSRPQNLNVEDVSRIAKAFNWG